MAELAKKLYIKKGDIQQAVSLYSTTAESGTAYAHVLVDGVQAYLPLGEPNDGRATIGRIKGTSGHEYTILTSGKPPYHKDSYTTPGTYTWTCPAGVTRARVTVAGGGGGGIAHPYKFGTAFWRGGRGALNTQTIDVTPHVTYSVVVGGGGLGEIHNATFGPYTACTAGGTSSFASISARGGDPAYSTKKYVGYDMSGASYGDGGLGGFWDVTDRQDYWWETQGSIGKDGLTGWVNVEYGGDI